MKCRSVPIKEIVNEDNPRLCLSALRYLGKCYKCRMFPECESKKESKEGKDYIQRLKTIQEKETELKTLKTELEKLKEGE